MKNKANDLRAKSTAELMKRFGEASKELFEMRGELAVSRKIERPHLIKELRREKARILTVVNEKKGQK